MKEKSEMEKIHNATTKEGLALAIVKARKTGVAIPADLIDQATLAEDDAYRVQAEVARQIGRIGGFKVANKPQAPRIMAPIFAKDVMNAPAVLAVPADEDIGIELEIGFRVDSPLPAPDVADRKRAVAECLSAVAVIEVVRTRLPAGASPLLKLADNQINGGLVVGVPLKNWASLPMGKVNAYLSLGDDIVLDGEAHVPGSNAFENFLVLEEMVGTHCGGLQQGQVVITGSLNGLPYVHAETVIHGRIDGLGELSFRLDAIG
ncbi:2-keto-4-pentenoate hydratase [Oceanibium sediminis]|uniref:2-keto-4-pentenoate hydratase n=1 Tax=Oceanibium sediminis TaxID=2026339 RepID=UPI001E633EAF|nr:2-keto-4-pentenoate hydratase [Oceanibium sediminis]